MCCVERSGLTLQRNPSRTLVMPLTSLHCYKVQGLGWFLEDNDLEVPAQGVEDATMAWMAG